MSETTEIRLGEEATYPEHYAPELLQPISRTLSRASLYVKQLPFAGVDVWTSYELSWLNLQGVPQVAIAEFYIDCLSDNIIESKSFKYYLNSYNQTSFASADDVKNRLQGDLARVANGDVEVRLFSLDDHTLVEKLPGLCVDQLPVSLHHYQLDAELLEVDSTLQVENDQLYSHLLKSNCPVTGQPDWASIWVEYSGAKIKPESFLAYVVSFRQHQGFHETCVEQIFHDLLRLTDSQNLSVYARYTRRGGLDINPFRSNSQRALPFGRLARQ